MPGRTLHYTASSGYRPQLVEIAPDATDPASKRYHTIEEEDNNLNRNLGELEEGTRARNREFLRRLVGFFYTLLYMPYIYCFVLLLNGGDMHLLFRFAIEWW
jgi:hypothetical protein